MIDGLMKNHIDPLWERMATPLVRLGLSPNQVTAIGMVLVLMVSAAFLWHRSFLVFGLTLIIAFAFDGLDGAVARRRNMCSLVGGYFDAMIDRYQELAVLAAIAYISDIWPLAMFAFAGSVFISYAKARTAIEIPVSNDGWPDFFERMERVIFLCALLVAKGLTGPLGFGDIAWLIPAGIGLFAILAHLTAIQRIIRAARMLKAADQQTKP
jgi:phosphatidylglycerophosphate synthase